MLRVRASLSAPFSLDIAQLDRAPIFRGPPVQIRLSEDFYWAVAHLVEPPADDWKVAGSIPASPTIFYFLVKLLIAGSV